MKERIGRGQGGMVPMEFSRYTDACEEWGTRDVQRHPDVPLTSEDGHGFL